MVLEVQRRPILSGGMYSDLTDELVQAREQAVLATDRDNAARRARPVVIESAARSRPSAVA